MIGMSEGRNQVREVKTYRKIKNGSRRLEKRRRVEMQANIFKERAYAQERTNSVTWPQYFTDLADQT